MLLHTGLESAHRLVSELKSLRPEFSRPINVHKLTPDGRSWLLHAERYWPLDDADVENLWKVRPTDPTKGVIMGREVDFPRRTAAYGVDYKYTGQVQRSAPLDAAPAPLNGIVAALRREAFQEHNALLLNWYDAKQKEYMGAHSDDERELIKSAPVVSLSWTTRGHYRRFRFTPRKGVADALTPDEWGLGPGCMALRNGCLVVMGGQCQATHKHELMKPTKQLGESDGRRINLTLRAFNAAASLESRKRQREGTEAPQPPAPPPPPRIPPSPPPPPFTAAAAAHERGAVPHMSTAAAAGASTSAAMAVAAPGAVAGGDSAAQVGGCGGVAVRSDSAADDGRLDGAWVCDQCTYRHEEAEEAYLCCKVCGAERL